MAIAARSPAAAAADEEHVVVGDHGVITHP